MKLCWFARRREFRRLVDDEAGKLIASEGGAGYYTARQTARNAIDQSDREAVKLWSRVARQVVDRAGLVPGHSKIGPGSEW